MRPARYCWATGKPAMPIARYVMRASTAGRFRENRCGWWSARAAGTFSRSARRVRKRWRQPQEACERHGPQEVGESGRQWSNPAAAEGCMGVEEPLDSTESKPEPQPLAEVVTHMLEEARMVLPGIQALFGFQMVAVFNRPFSDLLTTGEQRLHLGALALVALAMVLVLAPAAYHRQVEPEAVSEALVRFTTRCLTGALFPLMLGISLDFYLVARVILQNQALSMLLAVMLWCVFFV